jgi:condensin-2 complex subunit H2
MFFSLRRAKQLSLVQEDGTNRAVNSETPQEAEDEMSSCCLLQFLSLDDFPDSRANVDLKNEQAPSVSVLIL